MSHKAQFNLWKSPVALKKIASELQTLVYSRLPLYWFNFALVCGSKSALVVNQDNYHHGMHWSYPVQVI